MKLKMISALLLLCGVSSACATLEPPKTVDTSCLAFKVIKFAQLPPGQTNDPENKADSDLTVNDIMVHNARWEALCRRVFDGRE
ncbi:hypothetical protein [Blastomonas sp.]|uniref:hypothetical protein n=1 Tax=Blastomonas sp. TaxID=1909299 RepID=UPI0035948457